MYTPSRTYTHEYLYLEASVHIYYTDTNLFKSILRRPENLKTKELTTDGCSVTEQFSGALKTSHWASETGIYSKPLSLPVRRANMLQETIKETGASVLHLNMYSCTEVKHWHGRKQAESSTKSPDPGCVSSSGYGADILAKCIKMSITCWMASCCQAGFVTTVRSGIFYRKIEKANYA